MTIQTTTRFRLTRWSSDNDALTRGQIDSAHNNIELYLAKMIAGSSIPSVGTAAYAKTIFLNRTNNKIYYYSSEDSSGSWIFVETDVVAATIADAKGDLIVASGPNVWSKLPVGSVNQILAILDSANTVGWSTILAQKGDLLTIDGQSLTRIPVGTDNQILNSNSALATGLGWTLATENNISNSSISSVKINDSAVTAPKVVASAVLTAKFATDSVTETKIADGAVQSAALANDGVTTNKILDAAVTETKILSGSVTTAALADNSVDSPKFAAGAVTSSKFAQSAVTAQKLATSSVTSTTIAAGAVDTPALGTSAVTQAKIVNNGVSTVNIGDSSVIAEKIADGAITSQKIVAHAVTTATLGTSSVIDTKIANGAIINRLIGNSAVTTDKLANDSVSTRTIGNLAIVSPKFSTNSVTNSRIRKSSGLSVLGNPGNTTANISDIVAANDNTVLRRAGNFLSFAQISTPNFADGAVLSGAIADGALFDAQFSPSANIGLTKLAPGALPSAIKTGTVNYVDSSITVSKLSAEQSSAGVGVWLNYVPQIYALVNSGSTYSTFVLVPGQSVTSMYAKYMRINKLCFVTFNAIIAPSFSNLTNFDPENCALEITLPFTAATSNRTIVGSGHVINVDTNTNSRTVHAVINNGRVALVYEHNGVASTGSADDEYRTNSFSDIAYFLENPDPIGFSIIYEIL